MEQLTLRRRENILFNCIVFSMLSFVFLYLEYSYRNHLSPFSFVLLKKSVSLFYLQIVSIFLSIAFLVKIKKISLNLFVINILLVSYKIVLGLFIDFNKLIVVGLFVFIVVGYFLHQLLGEYFSKAFLNPNFSKHDLFSPLLVDIPASVILSDQRIIEAQLTNWDENGCFLRLKSPEKIKSFNKIKVFLKDRCFEEQGEVVAWSREYEGIGIKFDQSTKNINVFNWSEFMEIMDELGFQAERLR
jgi:hypothetical protein